METIVGNQKQEETISDLGTTANQMFPHIQTMVFKGCFRRNIRNVLKESAFQSWQDVSSQPPPIKKKFLHSVLDACRPDLEIMGMQPDEIDALIIRLLKTQEKHLKYRD